MRSHSKVDVNNLQLPKWPFGKLGKPGDRIRALLLDFASLTNPSVNLADIDKFLNERRLKRNRILLQAQRDRNRIYYRTYAREYARKHRRSSKTQDIFTSDGLMY
jgi:hypothetical protein